jgi:murein DD-endopeptidase MepM/ murein hydrolase activator NlpD
VTARLTRLARFSLCCLLAAGAVAAFTARDASAHESDCHAQQTCPSDDGSYVWTDSSGRGWVCVLGGRPEGTVIVFDGQRYTCEAVTPDPPPPPPPTEPPTTVPSETAPTPTTTAPSERTGARPDRKRELDHARKRAPSQPQRPAAEESSPAAPSPPFGSSPSAATPVLSGGPYVFPVLGPAAFVDTFGAPRATVAWHHGDDIFAPAGAPVLAVASGTLFSVGWNDVGGRRLWLRDRQGNEFYYAHLSGFSYLAVEGARVAAGEVLGYVGTTGDAAGTPAHLHFEVHPASMLWLGYDGAVNPTAYLESWRRLTDLSQVSGVASRPGAVLLQVSDISTASGLEPGSLERAVNGQPDGKAALDQLSSQRQWTPAERAAAEAELRAKAMRFARVSSRLFGPALWNALAACEASGDWGADTGNGYAGGLQFAPGTWLGYGGGSYARSASAATREQQIAVAEMVLAAQGWRAWPACSRLLGLD